MKKLILLTLLLSISLSSFSSSGLEKKPRKQLVENSTSKINKLTLTGKSEAPNVVATISVVYDCWFQQRWVYEFSSVYFINAEDENIRLAEQNRYARDLEMQQQIFAMLNWACTGNESPTNYIE